jgi:hypothetical protein
LQNQLRLYVQALLAMLLLQPLPVPTSPGVDGTKKASGFANQPSTMLSGILKDVAAANAVTAAAAAAPASTGDRLSSVNLLV